MSRDRASPFADAGGKGAPGLVQVADRWHRHLEALLRASSEIAALAYTARGLFDIIRKRDAAARPGWPEAAERSPYAPFARSLRQDQDAVPAALRLPWSSGMVEGRVHRVQLIKRQIYGWAGFDLLRLRVLHSA